MKITSITGKVVKEDERYKVIDNTILNNLTLSSTALEPKKSTTGHKHKGKEEIYIFTEGSGKMWLDDLEFEVRTGDIILIKDGVFHKVEARGRGIYFLSIFNGGRQ